MTLQEIYADYTIGSDGFVKAVQTHGGYDISDDEIRRLSFACRTAKEFEDSWENERW